MNKYKEIQNTVSSMETDFIKFYKDGNKAAGTRIRKALLEVKRLAQQVRVEVQELKNSASEKQVIHRY